MLLHLKSALMSGATMAVLAMAGYVIGIGDVFALDPRALINVCVMAFLTSAVSLIKSSMTTPEGTFAGVKVK